jgi:hypothetical protein
MHAAAACIPHRWNLHTTNELKPRDTGARKIRCGEPVARTNTMPSTTTSGKSHKSSSKSSKAATHHAKKPGHIAHPGMMGDGTEEQKLGERGDPSKRIKKGEVAAAFGKKPKAH